MTGRPTCTSTTFFTAAIAASFIVQIVHSLTLLSDLPTPCAVIHLDALRRRAKVAPASQDEASPPSTTLPRLGLSGSPIVLRPSVNYIDALSVSSKVTFVDLDDYPEKPALLYLHSRTIEGPPPSSGKDTEDQILAKIDLTSTETGPDNPCRLVLGLNNHHTVSYYWARAVGYGSSMDAIGVQYQCGNGDVGRLQWEDVNEGFMGSNSNDGKRSEWVNFLRKGDEVQLVPRFGEKAILANKERIYGVSSMGRPKGSEPAVLCQFNVLMNDKGADRGNKMHGTIQPDNAETLGGCDNDGWVTIQGG